MFTIKCIEKFLAWKYMIGLSLKENDLEKYVKDEVVEPKEYEAKEKHEQDLIKAMRIIFYSSLKCHLRRHQIKCMMHFPECMREGTSIER